MSHSASIVQSVRIHTSVFIGTDIAVFTKACKLFMILNIKDSTFLRPVTALQCF